MKKLLLIPAMLFTISSANTYTQADRIADMQKLAQSMQDIQSGFFYNNLDILKDGVKTLKETIIKIGPTHSEITDSDVYEKWLRNNVKMTNKIQKKIIRKADDIEERFSTGDPKQALQAYNSISGQCLKCHVELRKW
ncbi:MAG: Unknown protein [uncultured Sulfurovum sp.]|uniref:Cytochrome C n=1 Tax=uncultured Sulfurovum sp. TaxID=269237 RepID=A0A6S6T4C8_9BACT|nr:MAG: Unknown protein [uncultured Sulfurovum sp.]